MTQTIICFIRQNIKTSWHTVTVNREEAIALNIELLEGPYLVLMDVAKGPPAAEIILERNIPLSEGYLQRVSLTEQEWNISTESKLAVRFLSPKKARINVKISAGEKR